jgi:hypothetical protein
MKVNGKHWRFVLAPPSRMQQRGITADMILPGKTRVRLSPYQQSG